MTVCEPALFTSGLVGAAGEKGNSHIVRYSFSAVLIVGAILTGACNKTTGAGGQAGGQAGGAGARGGRGGQVVSVKSAGLERMSVQRQVDLAGTLLSPDMAKVSSEVAGIIRDVPVQLGTEVRAGDVLVRLDQRELQLAVDRAESQLHQVEAQLGIDRAQDRHLPADDEIASVLQAVANRDDAKSTFARALQLNQRGLLTNADHSTPETVRKAADPDH